MIKLHVASRQRARGKVSEKMNGGGNEMARWKMLLLLAALVAAFALVGTVDYESRVKPRSPECGILNAK